MDNLTTGDEARDLRPSPYLIHTADCYYPVIRGDIRHGDDEKVPLDFIVFISEPVLQERLEYLKTHTYCLRNVQCAFSENRVDGPLALPYALCLIKILRQYVREPESLSMKRLDDTIELLSTQLRGLLSTHLLYTYRDRVSRASLLLQLPVFRERSNLPGDLWQQSTVTGFSLDGLTVTLLLSNYHSFEVPEELWNGTNSLALGIADAAVIFGVG
ncbi:hypothetical protein RJ035_006643 [Blastomyces gilchristii]